MINCSNDSDDQENPTDSPDYSKLKSSDFIFGFADSNQVWIWITPKQYWIDNNVADDCGDGPNELPSFIYCEMEGTYFSEESLEDTKKDLLDLGFVYDKKFEDWNRTFQEAGDVYDSDFDDME